MSESPKAPDAPRADGETPVPSETLDRDIQLVRNWFRLDNGRVVPRAERAAFERIVAALLARHREGGREMPASVIEEAEVWLKTALGVAELGEREKGVALSLAIAWWRADSLRAALLARHRGGERWHATEDDLPMMLNLADECEVWGNTAWATRLREIALNGESFESFQSRRRPSPELRGSIRARHEEAGHLYDRLLDEKLKWFEEAAASDRQVHALTDNATLIECLGEIRHFAPSAMHWALNLAMARLAALDATTAAEQTND